MKQRRDPFTADLRQASFDEWLDAVFDHPPRIDPTDVDSAWYWIADVELAVDPGRQVRYLKQLFEQPEVLTRRYSPEQVEEGFWFMFGAGGNEWFRDTLWNPEVPWAAREDCIKAVPVLYERLFLPDGDADGMAWMLWDLLAFGYDCGNKDPTKSEDDRRVQDAMFEAMREMLMRSSLPVAQRAALHGLFHLKHASGPGLIRTYLDSRRGPGWLREYASDVLAGNAL